jgi:LacI family transcriptional regulator
LDLRVRRIDPLDAPSMRTGFGTAPQIVAKKVTAVLAYNDALAVGIIKGLKQSGLTVPGDISVVGFDNTVFAEVVDPALTTVVAPIRKAGAAGVGNVLALASGAKTKGETLMLPVKLVVRASTGPKRTS